MTSEPSADPVVDDPVVDLVEALVDKGVGLVASLPDSWLSPLLVALDDEPRIRHVRVARDDEGVAIVAGASLVGSRALLACQNAGLLLSGNALAGYGQHHQLPVPILAVLRGDVEDGFYYQAYKGRTTRSVLDAVGVPVVEIPDARALAKVASVVDMAWVHRRPVVALARRAAFQGGAS